MAYEILTESYGRRLPKITAEADSTDDLATLGTNYAEGSTCVIGDKTYSLDKVQGWVEPGSGGGGGGGGEGGVYTIQAEISYDDTTQEYTVSTEATFADIKSAVESGKPCFLFGERPEELFCAYLGEYSFAEGSEYAYFRCPMGGYESSGKVYLTFYELRCDTSGWSFTQFLEAVT